MSQGDSIFAQAQRLGAKDYATGRMINYGQKERGFKGATLSAWTEGYLQEHKSRFDESGIKGYKEETGRNISDNK